MAAPLHVSDDAAYNQHVSDLLKMIFSPTFLVFGLIGNIISIVIFNQKSMKKFTTFRYLTLLSIIDICALYIGFSHIMFDVYFDVNIRLINEASCKIQSFLVYFFTHFSSALLAVMSVDRTISITFKMKKFSTPTTALKNFVLIGVLMFFIDIHFLIFTTLYELGVPIANQSNTLTTNENFLNFNQSGCQLNSMFVGYDGELYEKFLFASRGNCTPDTTNKPKSVKYTFKICYADLNTSYFHYLANYFPWIDLFFYAILPFAIMVICSIIIIGSLLKNTKNLKNIPIAKTRIARNKQLFFILLATNGLFICLVSPLVFLNAIGKIEEGTILTTIAYTLAYANHGLNFVFYGISSESYRRELFKILNKIRAKSSNLKPQLFGNNHIQMSATIRRRRSQTLQTYMIRTNHISKCQFKGKISNL